MDTQRQLEELEVCTEKQQLSFRCQGSGSFSSANMQALRAMYPEDEGCFILAPAEQEAMASAAAAAAAANSPGVNLSGTVWLPGVLLEQQPVALRFQLPPGYPSAEPPQLSVECCASRWAHDRTAADSVSPFHAAGNCGSAAPRSPLHKKRPTHTHRCCCMRLCALTGLSTSS